ncbi:MAG: hypothetical protein WAW80_00905 [Candidatus Saccharimonadales bacterium]
MEDGGMKKKVRLPELTTKYKIVIGLGIFVFLGGFVVFVIYVVSSQRIEVSRSQKIDFTNKDAISRNVYAQESAADAMRSDNVELASDIYDQAINAESDPANKVELAIDHSRMLLDKNQFSKALEVAKKAELYSDDKYRITDWEARLYDRSKKYKEAEDAYIKASNMVDSPTNNGRYTKEFYTENAMAMKLLAEKK